SSITSDNFLGSTVIILSYRLAVVEALSTHVGFFCRIEKVSHVVVWAAWVRGRAANLGALIWLEKWTMQGPARVAAVAPPLCPCAHVHTPRQDASVPTRLPDSSRFLRIVAALFLLGVYVMISLLRPTPPIPLP